MSFEDKINQKLNKYPKIKKVIKRVYQRTMYTLSHKFKYKGDIRKISPNDDKHEYFFGYYGISPWDISGRYVICMRADDTWSDVAPQKPADILLIDTSRPKTDPKYFTVIATTHTWNVQQGCMAQWIGPKYDSNIIYNDLRDGSYCSVVLNVFTKQERIFPLPVYSVSPDGSYALTLDFSRLHRLRPGYGYSNIPESTKDEKLPDKTCIWKLDIKTGVYSDILKYKDFYHFETRPEMESAEHKVNHIMISPNGKRFMVLHRWFNGGRKYSRLVTANIDGTEMYNLSDDNMVSHCFWKSNEEILAFENKHGEGAGYYLMQDKTQKYKHLWKQISADGHPSYSPEGSRIVTDSYPNSKRIQYIKVFQGDTCATPVLVFSPFKYDNDTRCDLHPRWNRSGDKIAFDATFEGHRGLYYIDCHKNFESEK